MLPKKFYIPIGLCLVLLVAIGFLSLRSDVPDEPIKIYTAVEPLPKSTAEAPVGETSQGGHFHADGTWDTDPHTAKTEKQATPPKEPKPMTEVDMPLDHTHPLVNSSDEDYRKREQRRAELSQRAIELANETELLSQAYLGSVDTELSLINSFLAGISKTDREIARQELLQLYPDKARDLNDFFNAIENAPNLSHLEISENAKSLIVSREARDVMKQQIDAKWKQLRIELDEFYGDELSNALEDIKSQKGSE